MTLSRLAAAAWLVAAAVLLVACQTSAAVPQTPPPGAVYVSAYQSVFEQARVDAPAGEAFTMYFDNRENVPHNVHVVDAAGASVMQGEIFNGPAARSHAIPALASGSYKLLCDIHPNMVAELVAAD